MFKAYNKTFSRIWKRSNANRVYSTVVHGCKKDQ